MKGQMSIARRYFLEAKEVMQTLVSGPPIPGMDQDVIKNGLAQVLIRVGWTNIDSNPKEALVSYLAALAIREDLAGRSKNKEESDKDLCNSYEMVSGASFRVGDNAGARNYVRESLTRRQRLAQTHSSDLPLQRDWAFALQRLGDIDLRTEKYEDAHKSYSIAFDMYRKLVQEDPNNAGYKGDLARSYYDLATTAWRQGDRTTAKRFYDESRKLRQALVDKDHEDISARKDLMITLARCGQDVEAAKLADSVLKLTSDDPSSLVDVACCYALCYDTLGEPPSATIEHQKRRDNYLQASLSALRKAVLSGYRDLIGLQTEPDLDPIRRQPAYDKIVNELSDKATTGKQP
jgi:tetratricopeptide (TPR) repeat protein